MFTPLKNPTSCLFELSSSSQMPQSAADLLLSKGEGSGLVSSLRHVSGVKYIPQYSYDPVGVLSSRVSDRNLGCPCEDPPGASLRARSARWGCNALLCVVGRLPEARLRIGVKVGFGTRFKPDHQCEEHGVGKAGSLGHGSVPDCSR